MLPAVSTREEVSSGQRVPHLSQSEATTAFGAGDRKAVARRRQRMVHAVSRSSIADPTGDVAVLDPTRMGARDEAGSRLPRTKDLLGGCGRDRSPHASERHPAELVGFTAAGRAHDAEDSLIMLDRDLTAARSLGRKGNLSPFAARRRRIAVREMIH